MARRKPAAQPAGGAETDPLVDRETALVEPAGGADDQDALQALLDGLNDPTGYEVCVFEINNDGTRHMLARQGVSEFDPWAFGEQYGGGTYEMRLREVDTKRWGRQRRFTVSPRVPRRSTAPTAPAAQPAAVAAPDPSRDMLGLMMGLVQNQAQQQTAILTALIGRPQTATPLGELVQAAQLLTGKGPSSPIGELLEGVERIQKMTAGGNSATTSDEVELAKTLAPLIGEMLRQPPARATAPTTAGGVGVGALPPASPVAAPSPRPAASHGQAAAASAASHAEAAAASVAIDTLSAIIVRLGLDAGGTIDEGVSDRITAQALAGIDPDALADMLDLVPRGHLPDYLLAATPPMVREQVAQHRAALQRIEAALRDEDDVGEASPPAEEAHRATA